MTTGQILLAAGIALLAAAALTLIIGECALHSRKKKVLRQIEREFR